jgi:hypothetical protein
MTGFDPVGSAPVGAILPNYQQVREAVDSANWTGIELRLGADPAAVERVRAVIIDLDRALDVAGLTNAERAKAGALTGAILSLVQSPEPEWKVIARLLVTLLDSRAVNAALNAAQIAGLIVGALKLLGVW